MRRVLRNLTIGGIGAALLLAVAGAAEAAPVSKCNAAKKKCIGKYVAAVLGCHAKAESKGVVVEPACVAKAVAKITSGGKGCFDKQDAKVPNDCGTIGDAAQQLADADDLVLDVVTAVDPAYPAPTLTKCGAARKKCAGKKAAGLMGCSAKLSADGIGDAACAPRIMDKFGGAGGCDVKALLKDDACLGSTTTAALEAIVDAWAATAEFVFDYVGPPCGNGVIDPGEFCDPAAPNRLEAACGGDFACNPTTCNCACPSSLHLLGDPSSTETALDAGWTGLGHGMPVVANADVTVALSACGGSERPCGTCTIDGPIPNVGATELRNRRCSNDTSIRCNDDTPCLGGGGTCEYYLGTTFPLATGGISLCMVNQFNGPIAGTVNLDTGAAVTTVDVTAHMYVGPLVDAPCPLCEGDTAINDDVPGGTCSNGERIGMACDANGSVPSRPDFGTTSLDCPPFAAGLLASLPIDLSAATAPVAKTLTLASPSCSGSPGDRCLCASCNNGNQEPCGDNADCPDPAGPIGPICGGRRCLGGVNVGAPCSNNTECPAGICARPGEPTKPTSCLEDSSSPISFECVDQDADGKGECAFGPVTPTCSAPHAQRTCASDADCTPGTCEAVPRKCFLAGGNGPQSTGTGTLVAAGAPDAPVHDTAAPILGSVFCVGPTSGAAVNNVLGLPGPGRLTVEEAVTARP